MLFFIDFVQVDKSDAVFFQMLLYFQNVVILLPHLYKRKQALLGSNLSGIIQTTDRNINAMDSNKIAVH